MDEVRVYEDGHIELTYWFEGVEYTEIFEAVQ